MESSRKMILRVGHTNEYTAHHKCHRMNFEECLQEARRFNSVSEFRKKSWEAYSTAFYFGWIGRIRAEVFYKKEDESTGVRLHHKTKKRLDRLTLERCLQMARKYKTMDEFQSKESLVYKECEERGWTEEVSAVYKIQPSKSWETKEACHQEALRYDEKGKFRRECPEAYISAVHHRWIDEICSHMKKSERYRWHSFDECHQEALKFNSQIDFRTYSWSVYLIALRYGWLDEICKHMKSTTRGSTRWEDKENCMNEAKSYSTRDEFMTMNKTAYLASLKHGWLDEICEHMQS